MIEAINYLVSINFIKNIKEFWNYFLDNNFGRIKKNTYSFGIFGIYKTIL